MPFPPGFIPHEVVVIVQSFLMTVAVIALGIAVIRAFTRRFVDRPPIAPVISANIENRLERIEQAVDAMAIEVERISESQRYLTKIMSEPRQLPGASGRRTDA
jgi:citrate lyase synthetase